MTVYIEYVILDNFFIDYIILFAVGKTLRLTEKKYRLIIGSIIGTVLAVFMPLIDLPQVILLIIKLLTGIIMVIIALPLKITKFFIAYIFFITYTFVLGGAIIGVLLISNADIYSAATLNYSFKVPMGLVAGICFIYIILMCKLVKYLIRRKNIYPFMRKIKLFYKDSEYETNGFIDSGNRLYDYDGSPVIIISNKLAEKMIPQDTIFKLCSGIYQDKEFTKKEFFTAQYKTSFMYLFKISKLLIYSDKTMNTIVNVSIGTNFVDLKGIAECEALLHSDLIE